MSFKIEITISEIDIINTLCHYDLGAFIKYENLSFGYANENFKVTTSKGVVLFRLCKQQCRENVEKEMLLMKALKETAFPAAYPIVDIKGNYIHEINDKCCLIIDFIDGEHPELDIVSASEVGKAIATLSNIPVDGFFKKSNSVSIENCVDLISEFKEAKFQYPEIFRYFVEQTKFLKNHLSDDLPKGLIHGDCFPDNAIFKDNQLKALIDFEEFAYDTLLFDLGMTINGFCFVKNRMKKDLTNALISQYESIRSLTIKEVEQLPLYIQWAAHGMIFWHLRNNLLNSSNHTQEKRVRELMERVITLRDY
jgi:homoserine kinase type II